MHSSDETWDCDRARRAIADSLLNPGVEPDEPALAAHLAGCAACRAERKEYVALWALFGEIPSPAPDARARERFNRTLAAYAAGRERASPTRAAAGPRWASSRLAIAAAVLIAALAGYGTASWAARRSLPVTASATDTSSHFLLLLHENESMHVPDTPEAQAGLVAEYRAWAQGLSARGELVVAEKLSDERSPWLGTVADGSTSDRSGDHVSGFFVIRAPDLAAARRIAEECPHLRYGGRIELRAIERT